MRRSALGTASVVIVFCFYFAPAASYKGNYRREDGARFRLRTNSDYTEPDGFHTGEYPGDEFQGGGKPRRKRFFDDDMFFVGGSFLDGLSSCGLDEEPCPEWTSWTGHRTCSASCGGGWGVLRRYCSNQRDDLTCDGKDTRLERCNTHECPQWTTWTASGLCSRSCGVGQQIFTRNCTLEGAAAHGCSGQREQVRACAQHQECGPHWSEWSRLSACTRTCGELGTRRRVRSCLGQTRQKSSSCIGRSSELISCNTDVACPARHGPWTPWAGCHDLACGDWGEAIRNRTCLAQYCEKDELVERRLCMGAKCDANETIKKIQQNRDLLNVHVLQAWSSWSVCSVSCGEGVMKRSRQCTDHVTELSNCNGEFTETKKCWQPLSCPEWSSWSKCGQWCEKDKGVCSRSRHCVVRRNKTGFPFFRPQVQRIDPQQSNATASPRVTQRGETPISEPNGSRTGELPESTPVLNTTNAWIESSGASGSVPMATAPTRGESTSGQTAVLVEEGMTQFPETIEEILDPDECDGGFPRSRELRKCDVILCVPEWSTWSSWSSCSSSCGSGHREAKRSCNQTLFEAECLGESVKYELCSAPPCWSDWSVYSPCTTSCGGGGRRTRWRECQGYDVIDLQKHAFCHVNDTEIVACNTHACPLWGVWSQFSECSLSCGGGSQMRVRECMQGDCEGEFTQVEGCNFQECPKWREWSLFTCCSVSCGRGMKQRSRKCKNGQPGQRGCDGSANHMVSCDAGPCMNDSIVLDYPGCGVRGTDKPVKKSLSSAIVRIVGGKLSKDSAWPWQVSLQRRANTGKWDHFCGGTLLNQRWVLSAGHCTKEGKRGLRHDDVGPDWSVLVGTNNVTGGPGSVRVGIKRIIVHKDYFYHIAAKYDIELIKLRTDVTFADSLLPACLPQGQLATPNDTCYVTGWGKTEATDSQQNMLLEAKMPIIDFRKCGKLGGRYRYYYRYYLSAQYHMCAGDPTHANVDTCEGDSGGPLVCRRTDGRWYVAGITSFSFVACGTPQHVGIYVPVAKFEAWIRDVMSEYSHAGC